MEGEKQTFEKKVMFIVIVITGFRAVETEALLEEVEGQGNLG